MSMRESFNRKLKKTVQQDGSGRKLYQSIRRRLDRSTARYVYKARNGKLLLVLTASQKAKLIFEQYMQTLFNKDLFKPSCTDLLKILEKELFCLVKGNFKVLWLFETKTFMAKAVNNF
jgi:hypothetical protein